MDSRPLGGAWTLDQLWERLGIGATIRRVAASRRLDGTQVERVVFALVAQRVAINGPTVVTDDQAYRAMDFLLQALPEIASAVDGRTHPQAGRVPP